MFVIARLVEVAAVMCASMRTLLQCTLPARLAASIAARSCCIGRLHTVPLCYDVPSNPMPPAYTAALVSVAWHPCTFLTLPPIFPDSLICAWGTLGTLEAHCCP